MARKHIHFKNKQVIEFIEELSKERKFSSYIEELILKDINSSQEPEIVTKDYIEKRLRELIQEYLENGGKNDSTEIENSINSILDIDI